MKKTSFVKMAAIVVGLVMGVCAKAQDVQMVTLQHGDDMQAYYGHTAFQQAMAAAQKGDLITLSGGSFASATIDKVVTIQGAGYVQDVEKYRYRTTMSGELNIEIPNGETGLVIEGVYSDYVKVKGNIDNLIVRKCRFGLLNYQESNSKNCLIDRCRVNDFRPDRHSVNFLVKNSILGRVDDNEADAILLFQNSIITDYKNHYGITAQFRNCISATGFNASGCSAYNCLTQLGFNSSIPQSNVWKLSEAEMRVLFADGSRHSSFDDNSYYKLIDEAAAKYIGTDGTQVGIYGGTTPFTDVPSNPQVVSKEIAAESDANGKLSVKIKVEAQQ